MFTLEIWVTGIETKNTIILNLHSIQKSKTAYEPNLLIGNVVKELRETYDGWHRIFTDGSKSDQGLGAGFYDQTLQHRVGFKINCDACIMTLELIAIFQALSYAINQNLHNIVIFSDSKSALQHVARCTSGSRGVSIAYEILKAIIRLNKSRKDVKLQWVPAHIGLRGNEEADRVAKLAALNGTTIHYRLED